MVLTKNPCKHSVHSFVGHAFPVIDQKILILGLQIKDQIPSNHNKISTMQKSGKNSGKKLEPSSQEGLQDNLVYPSNSFPTLDYPKVVNFSSSSFIASQLLQITEYLRSTILARRESRSPNKSLTYQVKTSFFDLTAVKKHFILSKKNFQQSKHEQKIQGQSVQFIDKEVKVRVTISTDFVYPQNMGYAFFNGRQEECFPVWIDKEPYTLIGVNYAQDVVYPPKLTDVLGILIAEQTRFNTLELFTRAFPQQVQKQDNDPYQIYKDLFELFKVPIYNAWNNRWPSMQNEYSNSSLQFELSRKAQKNFRDRFRAELKKRFEDIKKIEETKKVPNKKKGVPETKEQLQGDLIYLQFLQFVKENQEIEDKECEAWMHSQEFEIQREQIRAYMIKDIPPQQASKVKPNDLKSKNPFILNAAKEQLIIELEQEERVPQFRVVKAQKDGKVQYFFVEKLVRNRYGKII